MIHKWYYIAYLPLGSPGDMRPPDDYTFRPPSFIENYINLLFRPRSHAENKQTILQQIAEYDSLLDHAVEELDYQDELAKEIDNSDVTAWQAKYRVWLGRRRIVIKMQEVSPLYQGHPSFLLTISERAIGTAKYQ